MHFCVISLKITEVAKSIASRNVVMFGIIYDVRILVGINHLRRFITWAIVGKALENRLPGEVGKPLSRRLEEDLTTLVKKVRNLARGEAFSALFLRSVDTVIYAGKIVAALDFGAVCGSTHYTQPRVFEDGCGIRIADFPAVFTRDSAYRRRAADVRDDAVISGVTIRNATEICTRNSAHKGATVNYSKGCTAAYFAVVFTRDSTCVFPSRSQAGADAYVCNFSVIFACQNSGIISACVNARVGDFQVSHLCTFGKRCKESCVVSAFLNKDAAQGMSAAIKDSVKL